VSKILLIKCHLLENDDDVVNRNNIIYFAVLKINLSVVDIALGMTGEGV